MRLLIFVACLSLLSCTQQSPSTPDLKAEETAIRTVLQMQEDAWNAGDIVKFMEGYWKSDSLQFIGSRITNGWQATLEGYQKTYPDKATMGQLTFEFFDFKFIGPDACLVTGRYHLKRDKDEPTGMFTLLLQKMNGAWVIVYDHTS